MRLKFEIKEPSEYLTENTSGFHGNDGSWRDSSERTKLGKWFDKQPAILVLILFTILYPIMFIFGYLVINVVISILDYILFLFTERWG